MSLIIGRTTFDCGPTGGSIVDSGQQRSFEITVGPGSLGAAVAMRQQLLGYTEPGQEVVPVQWDDDPTGWDGFWRIRGVRVTPVASYLTNGLMRAQVTMERIGPSWAQPDIVLTQATSLRPNTDGVLLAATSADVFFPSGAWFGSTTAGFATTLVSGGAAPYFGGAYADATLRRADRGASAGTFRMVWAPGTPDVWYRGASYVEWADDAGVWWPLVGTQLPLADANGLDFRVRLGSSLVRVGATSTNRLGMQRYDGAGTASTDFHAAVPFDVGVDGAVRTMSSRSPRVLVNTPTVAVVRYQYSDGVYATVSIQRGHVHAEVEVNYALATAPSGVYIAATGGTGTAITGGIKRSTNDATGNRWAILAPSGTKTTASSANISALAASGVSSFAIHVGPDADIAGQAVARYFASITTSQRVIA